MFLADVCELNYVLQLSVIDPDVKNSNDRVIIINNVSEWLTVSDVCSYFFSSQGVMYRLKSYQLVFNIPSVPYAVSIHLLKLRLAMFFISCEMQYKNPVSRINLEVQFFYVQSVTCACYCKYARFYNPGLSAWNWHILLVS